MKTGPSCRNSPNTQLCTSQREMLRTINQLFSEQEPFQVVDDNYSVYP